MAYPEPASAQVDPECRVSFAHSYVYTRVGETGGATCLQNGSI
jgi:hypothetical protein